ncbi:procathepsin L-like [Clytia hemisphaerica]|uniref:Cathepsin L n=1 Tax=Clytia hemisphaerica TaxID=252671 RepID=A0A7M5UQ59_9CNID|eukprot:TCONS_00032173-protein
MMKLLALLCLIGVCVGYTIEKNPQVEDNEWLVWRLTHKKAYKDLDEERVRYAIWKDNAQYITEFNAQNKHMKLKINHFGDYTNLEFRAQMNGYRTMNSTGASTFMRPAHLQAPQEVDWRQQGYVTPVKNQGQCGSCWAFSTTGSLEGQHFKKTGQLVSLSEQNLVDCSGEEGNNGCNGGLMDYAFRYIQKDGIDTEESYPYTAQDGTCKFSKSNVGATVSGYTDVSRGDENALRDAIASVGPISVAIDASHRSFQFYSTGVYYEPQCSSTRLDHGVLAVGYGSDNGQDYWLVKNSWGMSWGSEGYIKMRRNYYNNCGVASQASYPLV